MSNQNSVECPKLFHFLETNKAQSCTLLDEDLDSNYDLWKSYIVGYVAGKFPGLRALNSIIFHTWHYATTLTTHDFGLLVYKFNIVVKKKDVLSKGP